MNEHDHPAAQGGGHPMPIIAHIYATSAVLAFVSTFLPLWSSVSDRDDGFDTMTLWSGAVIPNTGGSIAMIGLVMMIAFVGLLLLSAWLSGLGPSTSASAAITAAIAASVIAVIAIALLATKPYSSTPKPDLGEGGSVMLGVAVTVISVTAWHGGTLLLQKLPENR